MLRFGVSARAGEDLRSWRDIAARAEQWGFTTFSVADHIGNFDPFVALVAAAGATEGLRCCTYVLNVGLWNPLLLARAAATAEVLTGGRLLLGLGAGHARVEFEQAGLPYPSARARVAHLARVVPALRRLLDGDTVDDEDLGLRGASVGLPVGRRVPLLVAGNGDGVLRCGAAYADVVGLAGFTSGTEHRHTDLSHWSWDGLGDRISFVRAHAGPRAEPPELDVLVQQVVVTDDRAAAAAKLAAATGGPPEQHLDSPFLLLGTESEILGQLQRLHRMGVASITVFDAYAQALAPVIERVRG